MTNRPERPGSRPTTDGLPKTEPLTPAQLRQDAAAKRMLRRLASAYVRHFPDKVRDSIAIRFDVVSVYLNDTACELMEGAF